METGKSIDDVADALIRAFETISRNAGVCALRDCRLCTEPIKSFRRVRRYRYEMMGIVYPKYAEENVLIDYGIIEEEES